MKKIANLIFPHQLFQNNQLVTNGGDNYIIEEYLFFNQYAFHKQKLAFHRASMKQYELLLQQQSCTTFYIESVHEYSNVNALITHLKSQRYTHINYYDVVDNWLQKRIQKAAKRESIQLKQLESPLFINTNDDLTAFFKPTKKSFFQTSFYKQQRVKHHLLVNENGEPEGGKWTFDAENRKKHPAKRSPPTVNFEQSNSHWENALNYVNANYTNNPGELNNNYIYPTNHQAAQNWLNVFLNERFDEFGIYEDAIKKHEVFINHSLLSPLINVGLLNPLHVVNQAIKTAKQQNIPLNSLEGFVRQIVGWREFIRGMYTSQGTKSRTANFWGFERKIPASFYNGTTGIEPIDDTIKKVLKTSYNHHIERLMIVGNFMVLCELHPDAVHQWFMEMYIDAYDWVMVPNVYGMSQFADGGLFATKPYISGSNYIIKMSDYKKGEWSEIWDALYWRFIAVHQDFFSKNPRLNMMVNLWNKMPADKRENHINKAEAYLQSL